MDSRLTEWQIKVRKFLFAASTPSGDILRHVPPRVLSFADARGIHPFALCASLAGEFAGNADADVCRDGNSYWADAHGKPGSDERAAAYAVVDDLAEFVEENF